jgi:hypothetical protein
MVDCVMPQYALVQKLPPESWGEADRCGAVGVLAVGTQEQLERFLEDYRRRLEAAFGEWSAWDDQSGEWDEAFDAKYSELCQKYDVSTLMHDAELEILPVGVNA